MKLKQLRGVKPVAKHSIFGGILLTSLLTSGGVAAAGFQLQEQSTSGLGRAFAGEAAIADGASAIGRNPALSSWLQDSQISAGFTYIDLDIDATGTVTNFNSGTPINQTQTAESDIIPEAVVPYAYYTTPVNQNLSFGLALNTYFGLKANYSDDFAALDVADLAEITTVFLTPSLSYKLDENFSIAFGLSLVHAEGELKTSASPFLSGLNPAVSNILSVEGDDFSHGWQAGFTWQSEGFSAGISHRSEVDLELDGTSSSDASAVLNSNASLALVLPDSTEFSMAFDLSESWMFSLSATFTGWSDYQGLAMQLDTLAGGTFPLAEEQWENSWRSAIGLSWQATADSVLRAGVALDESPINTANRTLGIPDSDRLWATIGGTHNLSNVSSIDWAIALIYGEDVQVADSANLNTLSTRFVGDVGGNGILIGLSYNQKL